MAPLVIPNAVLVRLIWAQGGTPYAVNVYGATKSGAVTVDQNFANALSTSVKTEVAASGLFANISNTVTHLSTSVRDISQPNRPEYTGNAAPTAGTDAGNLLPPQVAFCITLRTDLAGKSYRGRSYLPGFTVAHTTATGAATAGLQTNAIAFVNAVKAAMTANNLTMAVLSRQLLSAAAVTLVQSRNANFETIRGRAIAGI